MKMRYLLFTIAFLIITITLNAQVTDIDGNVYKTVKIGKQVWMTENLNVSHFRNGDLIPEIKDNKGWVKIFNEGKAAWCNYNKDDNYGKKYGKLYNLNTITDSRGLAPKGWHIPSDADWKSLADYLGGWRLAGKKMKTTYGWIKTVYGFADRGNGTNEGGFSALPFGLRNDDGKFDNGEASGVQFATWWSSSKRNTFDALPFNVESGTGEFGSNDADKGCGFSVRCVKD